MHSNWKAYVIILFAFLVYSFASVFSKMASEHAFLSGPYLLWLGCAILMLGLFAVLWQQIIKRMPISDAYMFKGTSLIFVLLFSHLFFGEAITVNNLLGAAIIIGGIAFFAKA